MTRVWKKINTPYGGSFKLPISPQDILLLFLAVSFAITSIDVAMAHSQNNFVPIHEWIPLIYSPIAAVVTFLYVLNKRNSWLTNTYIFVMISGIIMGFVGAVFHFFGNLTTNIDQPVKWLIFGTPIFAPIAFVGMAVFGLALIKPRVEKLLKLIGLGFFLTGLTAFFDHGQTHFESPYTYIPMVAGVFAWGVLWLSSSKLDLSLQDNNSVKERAQIANLVYGVMLMMIIVGLAGFYHHVIFDLDATIQFSWARILYKAPVLAPLIFAQLGSLGILATFTEKKNKIA